MIPTGASLAPAADRTAARPEASGPDDGSGSHEALVAALFAVDPTGLGGVLLQSGAGPARDAWLDRLRSLLPSGAPWRRVPLHVNADRLLGGIDLAATLQAGRPVAQRGLLAEADGGVLLLAMAERVGASTAASLCAVLDTGELLAERDGVGLRSPSRTGVVALDESQGDDEPVSARLRERLAFVLRLEPGRGADPASANLFTPDDVAAARLLYPSVGVPEPILESLCATALALGVDSARASLQACRTARAVAALDDRNQVNPDDAALAAALVFAPRATRLPAHDEPADDDSPDSEPEPAAEPAEPAPAPSPDPTDARASEPPDSKPESPTTPPAGGPVDDVVLEAALAAIPPGLLALLALGPAGAPRAASAGRAGAARLGRSRGRPVGARRGEPQGGSRLNVIETLRAAAPWQLLRRREALAAGSLASAGRVQVRREDFHVWRFRQRSETTTVFVVDASGSAALHRLAEAKGAVELLLADCYVRRDSVAVIAFRGSGAELLLPPTRSLVRAKRSLAGLPGGGGTPLAAGIDAARTLADSVRRRGATPIVVMLTDGRGNIARDGTPGRTRAAEDALAAARSMRIDGIATLLLDTSPQPQAAARELAAAMGGRYLPLPYAGADLMSQAVRAAGAAAGAATR